MVRPICFMIMPFGVKPTQLSDDDKAPAKVDFNRMLAITLIAPPQWAQVSISILNTRFKRCAHSLPRT